jgi:hypothetical protein
MTTITLPPHQGDELVSDYKQGLLHMLWLRTKEGRRLLFAELEFFPNEIEEIEESTGTAESNPKLKGKLDEREQCLRLPDTSLLFYIRIKQNSKDLLHIYEQARNNQGIPMSWCKPEGEFCHTATLAATSPWPHFTLGIHGESNSALAPYPYVAQAWGVVRTHHLYPIEENDWAENILFKAGPAQWIADRLGWRLSDFTELCGSVHVTLPNPIYRYLELRNVPAKGAETNDYASILMHRRHERTESDLELILLEKKISGVAGGNSLILGYDTTSPNEPNYIELTGKSEQTGYIVRCPSRGILDFNPFSGFIKRINVTYTFPYDETLIIHEEDQVHQVDRKGKEVSMQHLGEDVPGLGSWGDKIVQSKSQRESRRLAKERGQMWLDSPDSAQAAIKDILSQANAIVIVDPYFSRKEFFAFILAVCPDNAMITIVTGREGLGRSAVERMENAPKLQRLLDALNADRKWQIEFEIMTGDKPIIHDRFIVVDDSTVWFSGNSLNNIGDRCSILTKLHDPQGIIEKINAARVDVERVKPLAKYAKNIEGLSCSDECGETQDG